ncbi:hypothetical protein PoB_001329300 [Plakobranchus ocellatus]|uniref:Uncharacterized protein n=1 Tax=Plakobranchus ocellatus TaxID=259542 RepID=A0AAV3YWL8_9GAST|nr:hypothetical protein PoB_001329300 [Plakobranchus ocellatus]
MNSKRNLKLELNDRIGLLWKGSWSHYSPFSILIFLIISFLCVIALAYRQGLVWPRHVWIITELNPSWWQTGGRLTNCTNAEIKTSDRYAELIGASNCEYCNYAFDAVMAAGIVLHRVHESGLPLENFSYTNKTYALAFAEKLRNLSMDGISVGLEICMKRQATFLGHVMRRGKLEHLVTTGKFEGKRSRGRQREKIMDGLATWLGPGKVSDTLAAVKDRDLWRDMIANAYKQGT